MSSPDQPTSASPDQLLVPRDALKELKRGKITTFDIEMPPAEAAELILDEFLPEEPTQIAGGGILTASNLSLNSIKIEPHQRFGNLLKANLSVDIEIKGGFVPASGKLNLATSFFNMGGARAAKYAAYPDIPSRDQRFAGILLHNTEGKIDFQGQGNASAIASGIKERLSKLHKSVKDNLGKKIKEESSGAGSPKKIGEFRVFIGPDKVRVYITTS